MRLTGCPLAGILFLAFTSSWAMAQDAPTSGTAQPYQWSTYAGNPGGLGYLDGTGTAAEFAYPQAVAVDGSGNIYVADSANQVIREITSGTTTTIAGAVGKTGTADGLAASARFDDPEGITVDGSGNIYVADTGNNTIRVITSGTVSTLAGVPRLSGTEDGFRGHARFKAPTGIALDGSGNIYIADSGNDTIRRIDRVGPVRTIAGKPGLTGTNDGVGSAARFKDPTGIVIDGTDRRLFVADTGNDTIRTVTLSGSTALFSGIPGQAGSTSGGASITKFDHPTGLAVDSLHQLYVADSGNDAIRRLNHLGTSEPYIGKDLKPGSKDGSHFAARFDDPMGLAIDSSGDLFVADTKNSTIREVTTTTTAITIAGSPPDPGYADGPRADSLFDMPGAVAVDGSNNVFVADTKNDVIRRISNTGEVTTVSGSVGITGTSDGLTTALYNHPGGIAIDGSGNAYVADTDNNTIRMIATSGTVTTIAGSPGISGTSNGVGSAARFHHPRGIAVDATGKIYVADTDNDTIRVIVSGTVSTFAGIPRDHGFMNGANASALFNAPEGLAIDGTNGIYVADTKNEIVRFIATSGTVSTFAGKPEHQGSRDRRREARFDHPAGIAIDNHHTVFVSDAGDNTILEIDPKGFVSTIGGMAGVFGSTAASGTAAKFAMPEGIASTKQGVLYVADTVNNRIALGARYGSVTVNILPAAAVADGRWYIDEGAPMESGSTETGLTAGTHKVHFTPQAGYRRAPSFDVVIVSGTTVVVTGTYGGIAEIELDEPLGTPLQAREVREVSHVLTTIHKPSVVSLGAIVSGSSVSKTFYVLNTGTGPLEFSSVSFVGAEASRYSTTPLPAELAIGGTASFSVSCTPDGFGRTDAEMDIASNAQKIPHFVIQLTASGTNGVVDLISAKGNFRALISVTGQTVDGFLSLTIGKNRVVTGSLVLDGVTTKIKGSFFNTGEFTGTPANLSMLLTPGAGQLDSADYQIIGESGTVPFMAWHAAYASNEAVKESPEYTILLDATNNAVTIPQGASYLTLTVAKGGTATLKGKLADGTTVTYSTFIASGPNGHQIYVYDNSLYSKKGLLAGILTFEHRLDSDADGMMEWVHPAVTGDLYPQAFNTLLDADASKYIPPQTDTPALPLLTGTLSLSDGGLSSTDDEPILLTTQNTLLFEGANPNGITVTIDAAKGSFSGSFIHPVTAKKVSFSGLLYQNAHSPGAEGYFIGPIISGTSLSGDVLLTP